MTLRKQRRSKEINDCRYDNDKERRGYIRCTTARLLFGLGVATSMATFIGMVHLAWSLSDNDVNWKLSFWDSSQRSMSFGVSIDPSAVTEARMRRKRNEKRRKQRSSNSSEEEDDLRECTPSQLEEQSTKPMYGCAEMTEMLEGPTEFIGQGYWRDVRLATYNGQQVAVKTLKMAHEETHRNFERHRWEAVALDAVKDHPNIVHILGLCDCDIVTEYFPLYMDEILLNNAPRDPIPEDEIIRMALDAARGLRALHEVPGGPVVHADLQPRQLLMDEDGTVKLNDLNRCRFMARDSEGKPCSFKISKGNGVWRSPEEYAWEPQTEKLDIYSMGMIFWSMFGRRPPFERDDDSEYKDMVMAGVRPYVAPSWHQGFTQLFQDMWAGNPLERPTAAEVVERLEEMLAAFEGPAVNSATSVSHRRRMWA